MWDRKRAMVYRRTHQVVKRLAARRSAILAAAREAAAEGGMAAVQIAPVAVRANVAAGTARISVLRAKAINPGKLSYCESVEAGSGGCRTPRPGPLARVRFVNRG